MPRARSDKGGFDLRKLPFIFFRKLGRQKVDGLANHPLFAEVKPVTHATIELDPSTKGLKRLEIAIHESLHIAAPGLPETVVRFAARYVAKVVWHLGYRADDDEMAENFPFVERDSA